MILPKMEISLYDIRHILYYMLVHDLVVLLLEGKLVIIRVLFVNILIICISLAVPPTSFVYHSG